MASDLDLPKMIETVRVAFEALAKDKSVQQLQQVITHNKQLIHDNERLKILHDGNLDSIAKMRTQVQENAKAAEKTRLELQSRQKKIDTLTKSQGETQAKVTDLTKQLEESSSHMSKLQTLANQRRDLATQFQNESEREKEKLKEAMAAREQLQSTLDAETKLCSKIKESLEGYTLLEGNVVQMEKGTIDSSVASLKAITSRMCTLLVTYVNTELSAEAFTSVSKAGKALSIGPMLNSNSSDAKYMRIALAMLVAAQALEEHIFQVTYLLKDNSLCQVLSQMAENDPVREAHVRAVLLPVEPQDGLIQERLERCVKQIKSVVSVMVADSQKEKFSKDLEHTCAHICTQWTDLQKLKGRITLELEEPFEEEPCMLLSSFIRGDLNRSQRANDSGTRSSNGQSTPKKELQSVDYEHAELIVWPAFLLKVPGQEDVCLQNCVVLSADQIENAKSEHQRMYREKRLARRESTSSSKPTGNKGGRTFLPGGSEEKRNHG
ncbi:hypothetical protein G7054_g11789 [Neopestalotiopsis clavispora]|nr:hypothetical protein G7054_g11789 [Neopestalotiopsis clavispora]